MGQFDSLSRQRDDWAAIMELMPRRQRSGGPQLNRRTPFVGREQELSLLAQRLDAAGQGEGGVVLIAGEPGIGKSRLLTEFARVARRAGWLVLFGRAYDTEGMPAYLPFVEAVREHLDACPDQELLAIVEDAPSVATLIPQLRARFPVLPAVQPSSPEADRFRLFEAVSEFFLHASRSSEARGLLVSLDDLHWADPSTLALLQHLARKIAAARLLVAGTYRTEEVDPSRPLFGVLAEFTRDRLDDRLLVSRLTLAETAVLVKELNGTAPRPEVSEAIQRQTAGNPFFIEEVVHQLRAEGRDLNDAQLANEDWGISEGVRQVVGKRILRLSPVTRKLVEAASVFGEGVSLETIRDACGLPDDALYASLEEAKQVGMLREEGAAYVFPHPRIRQVLYEGLSLPLRQELHLRAGQAIERLHAADLAPRLAALADHFCRGGENAAEQHKSLQYSRLAAEQALSVYAYKEAARHWQRAFELHQKLQPGKLAERCDLLLAWGTALAEAGEPELAIQVGAEAALAIAQGLDDADRARRACSLGLRALSLIHGGLFWGLPEAQRWVDLLDRFAADNTLDRVNADLLLAQVRHYEGDNQASRLLIERARALASKLDRPKAVDYADLIHVAYVRAPQFVEKRLALVSDLVHSQSFEGIGRAAPLSGFYFLGEGLLQSGDRAGMEASFTMLRDLAGRSRLLDLEMVARWSEACVATLDGELERAVELIESMWTWGEETGVGRLASVWAAGATRALLLLGRIDQARRHFSSDLSLFPIGGPWHALVADDKSEALSSLDQIVARRSHIDLLEDETWIEDDLYLLEAGLRLRHEDAVTFAFGRCEDTQLVISGIPCRGSLVLVSRLFGDAKAFLGQPEAARMYYSQALGETVLLGLRAERALTKLGLADVILKHYSKERAEALDHLDAAICELEAMKMQPSLERALRLRGRRRSSGEDKGLDFANGLTQREVEVLRLIAAGSSNREIADRLVVSVRTVERHITNIYAKIGARGKADATAYVLRKLPDLS